MDFLTLVAGFTCSEGQTAAYSKELIAVALTVVGTVLLLSWRWRGWRQFSRLKLTLTSIGSALAVSLALAFLLIGPLAYNSWGCDSFVQDLFFNRPY